MSTGETTAGEISRFDHPDLVDPGSEFTVIVETRRSAGTVVEVDTNGFDVEVTASSADVVANENGRVEFVDRASGASRYELTVNVLGGADGDVGTVRSWVNAGERSEADAVRAAVFSLNANASESVAGAPLQAARGEITSLTHPDIVTPGGQFSVSVETAQSAGTVVEVDVDGVDVDATTPEDDAVARQNGRIEFVDRANDQSTYHIDIDVLDGVGGEVGVVRSWVNADDRREADHETTSPFVLNDEATGGTSGTLTTFEHPRTVPPDGEFTLRIESTDSAGTVVDVDPDGFDVSLSTQNDNAVRVEDSRIELLDTGNTGSVYDVSVGILGGRVGDTAEIATWINAADRGQADDIRQSTFELRDEDQSDVGVTAAFDHAPRFAAPGEEIRFDAGPSSGAIDEYGWQFGDGTEATGKAVTHTYDEAGEYTVGLEVRDTRTETDLVETTGATVRIEQEDSDLVSGFTISETEPQTNDTVVFDTGVDRETVESENLALDWAFGDGTTAEGPTVSHQYSTADTYTVTLSTGTDSVERTLTVTAPPVEITGLDRDIGGTLLPELGIKETVEATVSVPDSRDLDRVEFEFAGQRVSETTPPYDASLTIDDSGAPAAPLRVRAITTDGTTRELQREIPIQRLPDWLAFLLEVADSLAVERTEEELQITYRPLSTLDVGFDVPTEVLGGEDDPAEGTSGTYDFGVEFGGIYNPLTNQAELTAAGGVAAEVLALAFELEVALTGTLETTTLELQSAQAEIESQLEFDIQPPLVPVPISIPIPGTDSAIGIVPTVIVSADGTFDFNADLSFEQGTVEPGIELEVSIGIVLELPRVPDGELKGVPSGGIDGAFDVGTDDWDLQATFFLAGKVVLSPPLIPGIVLEQDPIWDQPLLRDGTQQFTATTSSAPRVRRRTTGGPQPLPDIDSVDVVDQAVSTVSPRESFRLTDRPYEDVEPALASPTDSMQIVIWGQQDETKPADAGHDLVARWYDNGTWGETVSITDDTYAHADPVCAATANGDVLVAWKRLTTDLTTADRQLDTVTAVNSTRDETEIAYSIYDGESWSAPTTLTSTSTVQRRPTVTTANGQWHLAWESVDREADTTTVRSTVVSPDGTTTESTDRAGAASPDLGQRDDGQVDLAYLGLDGEQVTGVTHEVRDGTTTVTEDVYATGDTTTVVVANGRVVWASNTSQNPTLVEATGGTTTALTLRDDVVELRELSLSARAGQAVLSYVSSVEGRASRDLVYRLDRGSGWIYDRPVTENVMEGLRVRYTALEFAGTASFLSAYSVREVGTDPVSDVFATLQEFGPAYAIEGTIDGGVAGEQTALSYQLENRGDVGGTDQVTVTILRDGSEVDSVTHEPLDSGDSLTRERTVTIGEGGEFELQLDVPEPSLETEPQQETLIAASPRLRVDDVTAERTGIDEATVQVTLTNDGGAVAADVPVQLRDGAGPVATQTVSEIGAETSTTVDATIDPQALDNADTHEVRIDPDETLPARTETEPLGRTYLVRPDVRVEDVRYRQDTERFVRVLVSNHGPGGGTATLTIRDGNDTELQSRQISVGPARTQGGSQVPAHRSVDVLVPTLEEGQTVVVEIEPTVSNLRQEALTSVQSVETILPGEYRGTPGEVAVTADDGTVPVGENGAITVSAENADQLRVENLWLDWDVDVDVPADLITDTVSADGTITVNWQTTQLSASPTVLISIPDRYVGGEYLLNVVATGGGDVAETTATVVIE